MLKFEIVQVKFDHLKQKAQSITLVNQRSNLSYEGNAVFLVFWASKKIFQTLNVTDNNTRLDSNYLRRSCKEKGPSMLRRTGPFGYRTLHFFKTRRKIKNISSSVSSLFLTPLTVILDVSVFNLSQVLCFFSKMLLKVRIQQLIITFLYRYTKPKI